MKLVTLIATYMPKSKIAKGAKFFTQDTAGIALFSQFSGSPLQEKGRLGGYFWAASDSGHIVAPCFNLPSLAEDADTAIVTRRELLAEYRRLGK